MLPLYNHPLFYQPLPAAVEEEFEGIMVDGVEVRPSHAHTTAAHCLPAVLLPAAASCVPDWTHLLTPAPTLVNPSLPQVPDRPHAFDIRLEDGQTIYSRAQEAAAPSAETLPHYSDLFARLRAAGLQAAA